MAKLKNALLTRLERGIEITKAKKKIPSQKSTMSLYWETIEPLAVATWQSRCTTETVFHTVYTIQCIDSIL